MKKKTGLPEDKYNTELTNFHHQFMGSLLKPLSEDNMKGNIY